MQNLSRFKWFKFRGTAVHNDDFNLDTPKILKVNRPSSPNLTYDVYAVPKRDGARYYTDRYEDIPIEITIGVRGTQEERQSAITTLLSGWTGQEGQLIFSDRPKQFYNARLFKSTTPKDTGIFTEITLSFTASFCMYGLHEDMRDYLVSELTMICDDMDVLINKATWSDITEATTKQLENKGNYKTKPLITISGSATLLNMQIGDSELSIANVDTTTYVDCDNMTVYKIVDNKKVSLLEKFSGVFPTIDVGVVGVSIGGTSINVDITVEYRDTYIV